MLIPAQILSIFCDLMLCLKVIYRGLACDLQDLLCTFISNEGLVFNKNPKIIVYTYSRLVCGHVSDKQRYFENILRII